jgi:hypothetical protein
MMEDSKEEADAGSFGALIHFSPNGDLTTHQFVNIMEDALTQMAQKVMKKKGHLIGHIKAFVTLPNGTLKLNIIDLELGVETTNRINGDAVEEGEIKVMAAIVGLPDEDVEEIIEESLRPLSQFMEMEIEEHKHEGHKH